MKYDLPDPTRQYEVISIGIWSRGKQDLTVFPANTAIAIRIWDANGSPLYTSDVFDFSGQPCDLALRVMNIDQAHVQVSGSFYAGFQLVAGAPMEFGYQVDYPSSTYYAYTHSYGNQYGHSYKYWVPTGTWSAEDDDLMFDATVAAVLATPTNVQANPPTIYTGGSSTLSATVGSGETVEWYIDSCGGALVGLGTLLVVSPTDTTLYYARARNMTTGCVSVSCAEVTVAVSTPIELGLGQPVPSLAADSDGTPDATDTEVRGSGCGIGAGQMFIASGMMLPLLRMGRRRW